MNLLPNEYIFLFNTITAAEETLDRLRTDLMNAQRHAEELYVERGTNDGEVRDEWRGGAPPHAGTPNYPPV